MKTNLVSKFLCLIISSAVFCTPVAYAEYYNVYSPCCNHKVDCTCATVMGGCHPQGNYQIVETGPCAAKCFYVKRIIKKPCYRPRHHYRKPCHHRIHCPCKPRRIHCYEREYTCRYLIKKDYVSFATPMCGEADCGCYDRDLTNVMDRSTADDYGSEINI